MHFRISELSGEERDMSHYPEERGVVARPYAFTASNVIDPDIHMPARMTREPGRFARLMHRMPVLRWLTP
ncbi:hypothetical protein GCM10009761_24870 [Agromyces terreus]